jgi:RNA polymerase sigma-70 factor, ECF subfamily
MARDDRYCGGSIRGAYVDQPDHQQRDTLYREFVRLLAEHERQLSGYVHALIPLWQDAEDVLQDTKLRLWEQFESFRPGADFAAWAIAIAGYLVKAHRKRCQRQRVCFSDELLEKLSQHVSTISSVGRDDRVGALMECAKTLSDANRRLLQQFLSGHQRIKDLAIELGQTPSATRVALFRIRRSLFDCVHKRLQEERGR